jgi:heme/copper-type cytochrome/quinol oxidase subunit 2
VEDRSTVPDDNQLADAEEPTASNDTRRVLLILLGVALLVLLLGGLVYAVVKLVQNPATAEALRDTVIVLIGIESFITGVAVIILIVQVARLSALLQNEVRPMLEATNETLGTLRGTTQFLSEKMIRPVVRVNAAASAFRRAVELLGLGRFRP